MEFSFDLNKSYEIPIITLCNPDFTVISDIAGVSNLHIKPRFNAVSEVTFDVSNAYVDMGYSNNKPLPYYDKISKNRVLHVQDFGYFVIIQTDETNDGTTPIKSVTAYSYEYTLNSKGANISDGTYKFYDPTSPNGTLLQNLIAISPSWKIGKVSASLFNRYRTFEIPSNSLYSFLMEDVEKAYECIFDFDTENKLINAYTSEDIVKDTSISLSFNNLIKNVKIEETSKDIATCLSVHGSGDLSINEVNPLGTSNIYDFSYYTNENWMNSSLIEATNNWDKKVKDSENAYAENFSKLRNSNADLLKLQGELATFKNDLKAQEQVRSAQLPNISGAVRDKINELNSKISAKQNEINNKNGEISNTKKVLQDINNSLKFENNFTSEQILALDNFIFEASYTNSNFVVTDRMSTVEIQDMSKELLERGKKELDKLSKPSFTFSMELVNFLFLEKFKPFINELRLGSLIHAEVKEDVWVSPLLLEIDIDYDNFENFNMTFGNKFRLETNEWTFNELFNQSKVSNSVSRNYSGLIAPIKSGGLDDTVKAYMANELDSANQEIMNSKSQDISIGDYGIKGRKKLENGNFDNHQLMITNNKICMTDDNWQNSKLAIGQLSNGNYGIIADQIIGKLLAGNSLTITDGKSQFTLDGNGASLKNASFTIEAGNSKIIQNPTEGFKIQKKENNVWKDQFFAEGNGNLSMTGKINIASDSRIGGLTITENSIKSSNGNIVLESNGNAKIGALTINGDSARFEGTIRADRIEGQIVNGQIRDSAISAGKLQNGAVTGSKISNDTISGAKLQNGTVTRREIGNQAVGATEIIRSGDAGLDNIYAAKAYVDELYVKKAGTFSGKCEWIWDKEYVGKCKSEIYQSPLFLHINSPNGTVKIEGEKGGPLATAFEVDGNSYFNGDITVKGTKSCVQETEHYGNRSINAYETAEYYYGDIGEGETKNGLCQVDIEPIFAECVNLDVGYQVFLTPYGRGQLFVLERLNNCFIVCGDNMKFGWEIKAKRRGHENVRLKECK